MEGRGSPPAFRLISSEEDSEFAAARAWRLPFTLPAAGLPCDHIPLHVGTGRKARCTSCWRSAAAAAGAAAAALAVPPDVTVPVPPVNGSYGGAQTATSSHLGEGSEAADGEGGARESTGAASDLWAAFSFGRGGAESRGGFRAALNQLLRRGNDLEAAAVNHRVGCRGVCCCASTAAATVGHGGGRRHAPHAPLAVLRCPGSAVS